MSDHYVSYTFMLWLLYDPYPIIAVFRSRNIFEWFQSRTKKIASVAPYLRLANPWKLVKSRKDSDLDSETVSLHIRYFINVI